MGKSKSEYSSCVGSKLKLKAVSTDIDKRKKKKAKKKKEILEKRKIAEQKIKTTLDRNYQKQVDKKMAYDQKQTHAAALAEKEKVEIDKRKRKEKSIKMKSRKTMFRQYLSFVFYFILLQFYYQ